jgi:hypothetical protein
MIRRFLPRSATILGAMRIVLTALRRFAAVLPPAPHLFGLATAHVPHEVSGEEDLLRFSNRHESLR